jgi:hypothetical protein
MEECPICLDPCERDFLVTECCRKHFHTSCHTECMKVDKRCPTCRHQNHVVVEVPDSHFVEVRVACRMIHSVCGCVMMTLIIGVLAGFVMFYLIDQYMKPTDLNNTNSTNVTSNVHD